jgi:hypothetical protein
MCFFNTLVYDHPVKNSLNFCHPSEGGEYDPTNCFPILC